MTCRMHLINCRITFPGVQRHEAEAQCILELQTKVNESPVKLELFHLTDTLKESEHMNAYIFHVFSSANFHHGHKFFYAQNITKLAKLCEAISEVMLTAYYWFELASAQAIKEQTVLKSTLDRN